MCSSQKAFLNAVFSGMPPCIRTVFPTPASYRQTPPPMSTRAPVGLLRTRGLVPDGRCHAPPIPPARPSSWHSIARVYIRPQPRAVGRGLMRFLARAPDLALAMWAVQVFPMPRGNAGHSSTRINAGEFPHGPLRRLAVSHVELTTWIGGPGLFLHFFHAMHAQTRTVFCDPNRLFLGPYGKNVGNRTRVQRHPGY